jgi:hypothetical protein
MRGGQSAESGRCENPTTPERRTRPRKRQRLVDGFISFGPMSTPQPCTVCDLSPGGSKVTLWSAGAWRFQPGDRVTLYVPADRCEVDAQIAWRRANAIGMHFRSGFGLRPSCMAE